WSSDVCHARAVGIHLGRCREACVCHARAQAELAQLILNDAGSDGGRAEDLSLLISRSNVCHLAHRFDDGALELELRILSVRDEVKAIRDGAGLERLAVASGEGGTEF